jgi:transcriptional regulator with XRE-family HTH domain
MRAKQANTIDAHVGQRIRILRMNAGISQSALGSQLGVSFQQIQKYEQGKNRIGAGRAFEIAQIFQVPVAALYPDSQSSSAESPATRYADIMAELNRSADLWLLNRALLKIRSPKVRRQVIGLVRQLADDDPLPNLGSPEVRVFRLCRDGGLGCAIATNQ